MIVLPRSGFRSMAWANGGGVTHEIAAWPPGAPMSEFDWRVSMAEVREPGPFSTFAGIDRLLLRVSGARIILRIDGVDVEVSRSAPVAFSGEAPAACIDLPDGPSLDLNVMTRRGLCAAALDVVDSEGEVTCDPGQRVLVLDLDTLDAVLLGAGESMALRGHSAVARLHGTVESPDGDRGSDDVSVVRRPGR